MHLSDFCYYEITSLWYTLFRRAVAEVRETGTRPLLKRLFPSFRLARNTAMSIILVMTGTDGMPGGVH